MQPLIQHTITITVIETWRITWRDGQETKWQTTTEVVHPPVDDATSLLSATMGNAATSGSPLPIEKPRKRRSPKT